MEAVVDKLITEVEAINALDEADGGIADILPIQAIYFGDPGLIPVSLFPAVTVEPDEDSDQTQTTGYDTLALTISVSFYLDARAYFEAGPDEALGDRKLVQAAAQMRRWLQRIEKRRLDGEVLDVKVTQVEYRKTYKGDVPVKVARLALLVRKNYPRQ
jgi:hypothetical protein